LWVTYRQAQELGGQVRKGEKGTTAVFWKLLNVEDRATGEDKTVPLLRTFSVFHVSQVDGLTLPAKWLAEREPVVVSDAVRSVVAGFVNGPQVVHTASASAFYSPRTDTVTLPELSQFLSPEGYAETLFHELVHSTGHVSRLGRFAEQDAPAHFGSPVYAKEELVAEVGAWLLAAHAGVELEEKQAGSYLAGWLSALQGDPAMLVWAAQRAQKAADLVLGVSVEEVA
jgi:antirestriction protein ArdC